MTCRLHGLDEGRLGGLMLSCGRAVTPSGLGFAGAEDLRFRSSVCRVLTCVGSFGVVLIYVAGDWWLRWAAAGCRSGPASEHQKR